MEFARLVFSNGACVNVEVPRTAYERERGLMERTVLLDTDGMLFDFGFNTYPRLWMKNMRIPIDMIFVNAAGAVVDVHANVPPSSPMVHESYFPARYALEVPAGWAAMFGVNLGHTMAFG